MVNVEKHRELLNDTDTRLNKRLQKIFCLSNTARKRDKNEDKFILANCGNCGVTEIVRTNQKRKQVFRSVKKWI